MNGPGDLWEIGEAPRQGSPRLAGYAEATGNLMGALTASFPVRRYLFRMRPAPNRRHIVAVAAGRTVSNDRFGALMLRQKAADAMRRAHPTEGGNTMLFCLTADYTPQALNAMRENPNTNRRAAVEQLLGAAGGKLVGMYAKAATGPGVMLIFDVPDPDMAPAMCGVAVSAGSIQNVELTRLFTMEEVGNVRKKAGQLHTAYKPPGKL